MYIHVEVNYGNKSNSTKKIEKTKYSKCDEFIIVNSMLKCFGFIKPSSGLYDGEKLWLEQQWMFWLK